LLNFYLQKDVIAPKICGLCSVGYTVIESDYVIKQNKPKVFSIYAASSACALGMMPGSVKAVLRSVPITNINNHAPTIGNARDTFSER